MRGSLKDYKINKHLGQYAFGLHRITGILLTIYIIPHIIVNSSVLFGGSSNYDRVIRIVQGAGFHVLEILIILGVTFHLLNGIRIILVDFLALSRMQKELLYAVIVMTAVVFILSLYLS